MVQHGAQRVAAIGRWRRSRRAGGARPPGRTSGRTPRRPRLLGRIASSRYFLECHEHPLRATRRFDHDGTITRRRGQQHLHRCRVGLAVVGSPICAHHRDQAARPLRVLDGDRLHDHPAHRRTHACAPARCRGGRAGPSRRRPCRSTCTARPAAADRRSLPAAITAHVHLRRRRASSTDRSRGCRSGSRTGLVGEHLAEVVGPRGHLRGEAHHEQQGLDRPGAERVVLERDVSGWTRASGTVHGRRPDGYVPEVDMTVFGVHVGLQHTTP